QVRDEFRYAIVGGNQPRRHLLRVRRRKADSLEPRHLGKVLGQHREISDPVAGGQWASIGIDILSEKRDLLDALIDEIGYFGEDVVEGPRHFFAPGVGHDAKCAILAATFHDRDERSGTFDSRGGEAIELLDFWKAHVHLRRPGGASALDQLRQPMQGLRPKNNVDEGSALDDARALLTGHATADADDELRIRRLELADPS